MQSVSPAADATTKAAGMPADPVAERSRTIIDNAMGGWVASGVFATAGDEITLFGNGSLIADGLNIEPRHVLWYRIGEDGEATNFAANQETFTAPSDGEVFLTLRPTGVYWPDTRGTYPEGFTDAPAVPVDFSVDLVRFSGQATDGLSILAASGDAAAAAALATIANRKSLPDGFEHLGFLSRANVWADGAIDGRPGITAQTDDDFAIVRKALDIPLTASTEFSFDWRYDAVPALGPETDPAFHDYLSIAIEFDNGQDLTWMWSASLPADTHFTCPLPWWDSRETHFVLQSGSTGLGEWFSHNRNVLADYRLSVAGDPPTRIVGVWFIGVSLFGRQPAAASFADVAIVDGARRVAVF